MRCPRCASDNLPGLVACMACGQDLAAPVATPLATVPRVAARNPLVPPAAPARPRRIPPWEGPAATLLLDMFGAALWGLLPGLGAFRRGERRRALALALALPAAGLLLALTWRSPLQVLVPFLVFGTLVTASLDEILARVGRDNLHRLAGAVGVALALAFTVQFGVQLAFDRAFPRVVLADTPALPGGHFLVRPATLDELAPDTLVAVRQGEPVGFFVGPPVLVAPVLAGPGQVVTSGPTTLLVDGQPARAHALNPVARPPQLQAPLVVPDGHVALLTNPVQVVDPAGLLGRLWYRWLPIPDRGPLDWPPPAVEPP